MNTLPVFDNVIYYDNQEMELPDSMFNLVIIKTNPENIGSVYKPTGEFNYETEEPYFVLGEFFLNDNRIMHPELDEMFDLHCKIYPTERYFVLYPEDCILQIIDTILKLRKINSEIPIYIRTDGLAYPELKTASQVVILNQINQYLVPLYYKIKV